MELSAWADWRGHKQHCLIRKSWLLKKPSVKIRHELAPRLDQPRIHYVIIYYDCYYICYTFYSKINNRKTDTLLIITQIDNILV